MEVQIIVLLGSQEPELIASPLVQRLRSAPCFCIANVNNVHFFALRPALETNDDADVSAGKVGLAKGDLLLQHVMDAEAVRPTGKLADQALPDVELEHEPEHEPMLLGPGGPDVHILKDV